MIIDIRRILEVLPHRYPFLLVDRIVEMEPRKRVVGIKNWVTPRMVSFSMRPKLRCWHGLKVSATLSRVRSAPRGRPFPFALRFDVWARLPLVC